MKHRRKTLPTACGFGLAAVLGLGVLSAVAASPDAGTGDAAHTAAAPAKTVHAGYIGEQDRAEDNAEFFRTVMRDVLEKQAASGAAQVTVTYDASSAPTFSSQIANSAAVWNSAVQNVQLTEGSNASFEYREGDDPRGSYVSTDGHGSGYIFLDYAQNDEYDSDRVVAHETGHVLGLPDNYSGPCEELMSGGGPGPSCTNDRPNSTESAQVEQLWANGLAEAALTPHP